jgi:hypothetical protein
MSQAAALGLSAQDATVLHDSNRLVLRIMPCDVVARVAPMAYQASAELEVEVAGQLAGTDSPVALLDPRAAPRVYSRDGFVIGMWRHYEPAASQELRPSEYARALEQLHAGMRQINVTVPHFMDRIADTQRDVESRDVTPELADADRELLADTLRNLGRSIAGHGSAEQLLHGEPHPWNVLRTKDCPLFIDFEDYARGPVEWDLAWAPEEVSERYRNADQELVGECRGLMLAIVAACRWHRDDEHPGGRRSGTEFLDALRKGPPWPAVDAVSR